MHRVFISYHHDNDQYYKEKLWEWNNLQPTFIDRSVETGDIEVGLDDQTIRQKIRDEYLRDTTVTIVLVGTETGNRKHVDWEIFSSMIDGSINKKSGVIAIMLPSTCCTSYFAAHDGEKEQLYPFQTGWKTLSTEADYQRVYPCLPARLIDNLIKPAALVSVVNWSLIQGDFSKLGWLIEATFKDRDKCEYDLTRRMSRANS